MKHRSTLKILIVGPLALGLVLAVGMLIIFSELRTLKDAFSAFGIGAVGGLVIFSPIAFALAFGRRVRPWALANGYAVQWYGSSLMMLSLGYLLASVIHRTSDLLTGLAVLLLFLGVQGKVVFGIILRGGSSPSNGGAGPRPPLAPVLRPPGGRPPVLHAAAEPQHEPAV